MATRSISHKTCPSCAPPVATDTKRCNCGYAFDAAGGEYDDRTAEQALQEEELLQEYLDARIEQALAQLQAAQATLVTDPKNLDAADKLMRAFSEVRELRAERGTQAAKLAALKGRRTTVITEDVEPASATAPISSQPTAAFRAAQTAKIENIMKAAGIDTKECPKCHAVLPRPAVLCFCGFAFNAHAPHARGDQDPSRARR